jgi:hypothetical protein
MVGRPPKLRDSSPNRRKLVDKLLSDLANHQATGEKEAIERKSGQRMTDEDRDAMRPSADESPKTSR